VKLPDPGSVGLKYFATKLSVSGLVDDQSDQNMLFRKLTPWNRRNFLINAFSHVIEIDTM